MFAALCNQSLNCCGGILARFYLQLIDAFIFSFLHTSGPSCLCLGSLFCSIIELIPCSWSQADCLIGHSSLGFCGREQIHGSIVKEKVSRFWSSKAADHHGRTAVFDCRYVALIVKRCVRFTPNITRPTSSKKFGFLAHHYLSQILEGVITFLFFFNHICEVCSFEGLHVRPSVLWMFIVTFWFPMYCITYIWACIKITVMSWYIGVIIVGTVKDIKCECISLVLDCVFSIWSCITSWSVIYFSV